MKKTLLVLIALVLCICSAAALYYEKGDTEFSFRGGVTFPAVQYFPKRSADKTATFKDIHLNKVGGYGSLSYQVFLSKQAILGGEVGYAFCPSLEELYLTMIPFTVKGTYTPVQTGSFDLNLHANLGVAIIKYNGGRFFPAPYLSLAVNPVYYITDKWGLGLETGIWGLGELYSSTNSKSADSSILSMIPLYLTVTYRH